MTNDEARKALIDLVGDEYHIVTAFESDDAFIFTIGEDGEDSNSFDLDSFKIGKDDAFPMPLDWPCKELTRDYLDKAKQLV